MSPFERIWVGLDLRIISTFAIGKSVCVCVCVPVLWVGFGTVPGGSVCMCRGSRGGLSLLLVPSFVIDLVHRRAVAARQGRKAERFAASPALLGTSCRRSFAMQVACPCARMLPELS